MKNYLIGALLPVVIMSGCKSSNSNDSLRDPVSDTGISAAIQANLPLGAMQSQVAASVYKDGVKQPLVGGDIFKAYSESTSTILRSIENLSGDYVSELNTLNPGFGVNFEVEFDPQAAREDRWYPADTLVVDPGPSDLIGYSAHVDFPAELRLASPQAGEVYLDRSDQIMLSWNASADTEQIRITSIQQCDYPGGALEWARSFTYPTDTGTQSIPVGDLVPSTGLLNSVATIVGQLSVILSSLAIEAITYGLVDAKPINISGYQVQTCTITLTVFREVAGQLGAGVTGGYAIASTSDSVSVVFQP